ncbi:MAG: ROK family protein [Chloroflexi bacterium]|nr:ROK family protein [Chloroflexota bacterium]
MTHYSLAVDIGGTQIRVALVDEDGRIVAREAARTLARQGREDVVERLMAALDKACDRADRDAIVGVGLSMPGPIDPHTGVIYNPPNLPGWDGYSLKPELESRYPFRAVFGNDANLAALAEHAYGAGRGHTDLIYLTISTGIGGGIIADGRLYAGYRGFSGELGHMTIDPDGPRCNCGNHGCLEAMASGTAVARMARERLSAGRASTMLDMAQGGIEGVDASIAARAAEAGDTLALEIMSEAANNLGIGIVSLLHIFDPEIVVLGGGMSQSLGLLLPGIVRQIELRGMAHVKGRQPVVKSALGDDAGLLGAAALVFRTFGGAGM